MMQSIAVQIILLLVFFNSAQATQLRKCGEFDQNTINNLYADDSKPPIRYQNQFADILEAFDNNDTDRVEELFKSLEIETMADLDFDDEPTGPSYTGNVIKYVVCLVISKNLPKHLKVPK